MKKIEFEQKAPYYFKRLEVVFKKDGSLRQSKKLIGIIKKNHSTKMVIAGIPKFYMRVDSAQMRQFGNITVLVAVPDLKGGYRVEFLMIKIMETTYYVNVDDKGNFLSFKD